MSRIVYDITLSSEEYAALTTALAGGALAPRQAQLTELLRHNRDHVSIANGVEREIEALTRASTTVLMVATPREV